MSNLHPFVQSFGPPISLEEVEDRTAAQFARYLAADLHAEARLLSCHRYGPDPAFAVLFEVHVERPQDRAVDIRSREPILAIFRSRGRRPPVYSARDDFPDTAHQYPVPPNYPRSLCVDDRPWKDARATWTPFEFIERICAWLAAAADGTLTGDGQAIEPHFLGTIDSIVLPRSITLASEDEAGLSAWMADDVDERLVLTSNSAAPPPGAKPIQVFTIRVPAQLAGPMRSLPQNMADLMAELELCGCDLRPALRQAVLSSGRRRGGYGAMLVLIALIPIVRKVGGVTGYTEAKAFVTGMTMGEIGCKLGFLDLGSEGNMSYVQALGSQRPFLPHEIPMQTLQVHFAFDRDIAAGCSGATSIDRRKTVLVGAGAIGSHIAVTLAREGRFNWTVVDPDILLPHNVTRHALLPADIGKPKASSVARTLNAILGEGATTSITADFLQPEPEQRAQIDAALNGADFIIDASASVSVARHLSDRTNSAPRAASAFLNPAGTASVLLLEDATRDLRLDVLEAQYYRLILNEEALSDHLAPPLGGFRYAAACRSLSNRIPDTSILVLGGLIARALSPALAFDKAAIAVWSMTPAGEVRVHTAEPVPGHTTQGGDWQIVHDDDLTNKLSRLREASLPHETGGVLVGIADTWRKVILIVDALPPPGGSIGTAGGFDRGTEGLPEILRAIGTRTGGQVRYVGEWHSHPPGQAAVPSLTDFQQLDFLRSEMRRDSLPALMMIAGDDGEVSVVCLDEVQRNTGASA